MEGIISSTVLAPVNNTTINMCMQVFIWCPGLDSFMYVPNRFIVGSCISSDFNFLRNFYINSYTDHTNLHSYKQCGKILFITGISFQYASFNTV